MEKKLTAMLDSLQETGICIVDKGEKTLLYFNGRMKAVCPEAEIGMDCGMVWKAIGVSGSFPDGEGYGHTITYNTDFGKTTDIITNEIMWGDRIPAVAVIAIPHKCDYEERQDHEQIERLYTSSLVTVFDECIIVNLTGDYYVNCQKDMMWTEIPGQGEFDRENRRYAGLTVHPDDLEAFNSYFSREAMLRIFSEGKTRICKRMRRLTDNGIYHMVEFTAARLDAFSDDCWCVLVYQDIEDEYLLEQNRSLEISQLATAARVAFQMLISVNLTKNTYYMMEYERFDTKRAPEQGNFDDLIQVGAASVDPAFREEFLEKFSRQNLLDAFEKGVQNVVMELRQMGDDGQYHWNSTQVVRVNSPYTDDVLQITMTKNIDEERRKQEENLEKERKAKEILEEALEKAEAASRAKGEFLSRMSHDIRTPMNAVMGFTALARLHLREPERLEEYLEKIEISGAHLLGLINEVLDVSKIESGKTELEEHEFDLHNLLEDVVSMVQPGIRDRDQKLSVEIEEEIHSLVLGDEQKLRQVLVNVLENASKYTEREGSISLRLSELEEAENEMGTYRFIIEDTGIGMKKEFIKHIFEPFSRADDSRTSKTAGTGLGLTIVNNLIRMMGGEIQVESEYGRGSCFTITVFLMKTDSKGIERKIEEMEPAEDFSGMRILLAEDNELNRQIAEEMLEILGTQVESASNGREAVEMILIHPALYYDLVFMDVQMPVMDGYEATERIRSSKKERIGELPIIALTADAFTEDVKKTKMSGMNGHISKPIDMEKLRKTLAQCMLWKRKNRKDSGFYYNEESLKK
ncbi:response regulator [Clostridium sp. MCC353]|uniref:hybrid sensor histidine kinase/response regulator n=1 Tax=Clostridium sp. MCC353 TaxID=2592646 RepID=UPI001C020A0C|nr:ATP-binding protein [Clostridium sp. MCC353]MBT9779540.1 response regulator [Clostridium sp. MCC353]